MSKNNELPSLLAHLFAYSKSFGEQLKEMRRPILKNQTKAFIAVEDEMEDSRILGVDLSLEDAWKRHGNLPNTNMVKRIVIEMPIGSPFNFIRYDEKQGYKTHENRSSKTN